MKPYAATTEDYGDVGCCPNHDTPYISKWSGSYSSKASKQAKADTIRMQNRKRRRTDKQKGFDEE